MTSYIVADFDTEDGLDLLRQAVESLVRDPPQLRRCFSRHSKELSSTTRIAFLHNPTNIDHLDAVKSTVSSLLSYLHCQGLFPNISPSELLTAVGFAPATSMENESQTVLTQESLIDTLAKGGFGGDKNNEYKDYVFSSRLVAREIGLRPGQQALIVNGRVSPNLYQN